MGFGFRRRTPLVNFVIAGVQKGGTSSVDAYLRQHAQVCMARVKEVHYFENDERWGEHDWYERHFAPKKQRAIGEATPIYVYAPDAPRRLWEYNPAMRVIVLLRNPVQRAWSQWRMQSATGFEPLSFGDAIRAGAERCRESLPAPSVRYSYVDRGFYSEQVRRLRRFFPDEQLLFIKSEALFADPDRAMAAICKLLEVDVLALDTAQAHRVGPERGDIPAADRQFLLDTYRNDVAEVERLLGWDCADWRR